jgi:hypothetical protein
MQKRNFQQIFIFQFKTEQNAAREQERSRNKLVGTEK